MLYGTGAATVCVYVAGSGRNGSTLLGLHLGRFKDVFFAGELTHIWDRSYLNDELCGCGVPFSRCDFWTEVTKRAFGAFSRRDAEHVLGLRQRISALRGIPYILAGVPHVDSKTIQEYGSTYKELIHAISFVAGCQIVVDSSKYPTDMAALLYDGRMPMHIIHLVRNCQAVVFSWKRRRRRIEIHWTNQLMPRYGTILTALGWKIFNRSISRIALSRRIDYRLIRYEDMIDDLPRTLSDLLVWFKCSTGDRLQRPEASNHTVSGNPCRFHFNPGHVQLDDEWIAESSAIDRCIVNVLCGRDQRLYGY